MSVIRPSAHEHNMSRVGEGYGALLPELYHYDYFLVAEITYV